MNNQLSPLRLPVRTESGRALGNVVDVILEPDTQSVLAYHVKPSRLVPDVVRSPLVIHRSQVVQLNETEMVVDDAVLRAPEQTIAPQATAQV
ncbi:MAG: PRC-barrel domain-containing protein [Candidatus Kerfeldbacteria bacterium]|nr:PRC-barrel domain-containing protein [Candidatus Kerfeldbacteria bacterium]